jgi:TolB protein
VKIKFSFVLYSALLIYFLFTGLTVSAQVSFVEDLAPIEGVDVENEKKKLQVETPRISNKQILIGIADFSDINLSPQNITQIIAADLDRSGQFKTSNVGIAIDENTRPDFATLKSKNIDGLLTGSVNRLADGRYDIRYRLWDAVRNQDLGGQSFIVFTPDLRLVAHRIADQTYEKMTSDKGIFSTRITYITKHSNRHMLWVSDADGENAQAALTSPEPIISPSWSPNGNELAYVSFEGRKPVVYIHDVRIGKRRVLANFRGSNSAPAWSPDGKTLAVTLTKEGGSQIFIIGANGGDPRRITESSGIDTEPVFTADGSAIYFVSDRGGSPQIYRLPAIGGPVQRVTFNGNFNTSPALSPDGKWLAYISRNGNSFKLTLMNLVTDEVTTLTDSTFDSKPSFAPNSKLILYATKVQGKEALMTTTLDGKINTKLSSHTSTIREPHWGPFLKP